MINKELKYREEIFELLKKSLDPDNENSELVNLIKDAFLKDDKEINIDDFINKLLDI